MQLQNLKNNMNIFLLSMTDNLNPGLKNKLQEEIGKRGNRVAYVSSEPQVGNKPYYLSTIDDYHAINKDIKVDYFDLSQNFSNEHLFELLNYGTIYLSGGNTYVFMDSANNRNLLPILKKHLENDGLLIGASAGSIMMTPSIDLAEDADENIPNIKNTTGFSFVNFEFQPHFGNSQEEQRYLSNYLNKKDTKVYACKDGDGIYINTDGVEFFGDVIEVMD